jgi:hypothetical protein
MNSGLQKILALQKRLLNETLSAEIALPGGGGFHLVKYVRLPPGMTFWMKIIRKSMRP